MASSAVLDADEAGQALRAAGAGNDAELDLRQSDLRRRDGDAVVRRQRDFKAAAERRPVQRRDNRLLRVLDEVQYPGKEGRGVRLAELGDVGACDEGASGADEDGCAGGRVGLRLLDAELQALADGLRQRVDRG